MLAWIDTDVDAGWNSDSTADSIDTNLGDSEANFTSHMTTDTWRADAERVLVEQQSALDVPTTALPGFFPEDGDDLRHGLCSDQSLIAVSNHKVPMITELTCSEPSPKATGRKRSAEAAGVAVDRVKGEERHHIKASKKRGCPAVDDNAHKDRSWVRLIELLADESFSPGARPDRIDGAQVDHGLMFKEHPKRRRGHSSAAKAKDKWFNTGGIKSASDRFDAGSGFGLRKRYGKVVRDGGLPVLKFQEFSLLRKSGTTLVEEKDGPSLFHIIPPGAKRGAQIPWARTPGTASPRSHEEMHAELATVRRRMRELQDELAVAHETIKQQQQTLDRLQCVGVVTRRRKFTLPDGCR